MSAWKKNFLLLIAQWQWCRKAFYTVLNNLCIYVDREIPCINSLSRKLYPKTIETSLLLSTYCGISMLVNILFVEM